MSAEADVYTLLSAVPALGGRIYPLVLPQEVPYPAASYQRISAERYSAFGRDALPVDATIQVDVYSMRVPRGLLTTSPLPMMCAVSYSGSLRARLTI